MSFWGYRDYVSVADRRAKAVREIAKLNKQGRAVSPVVVEGRKIAKLFWGKAWCDNLERYSDFANRLPRGRSYVCNGLVVDLAVSRGKVEALVTGSDTYKVKIDIAVAAPARWKAICADCSGSVGSIVELLQGKLSSRVMERVCRADDGLFPAPKEIKMSCSCPDWADMCKHVAAALYGVGARLDVDPNVLFTLRGVDRAEVVSTGADISITQSAAGSARVLVEDDLSALFGVEIEPPAATRATPAATRATPAAKRAAPAAKRAAPAATRAAPAATRAAPAATRAAPAATRAAPAATRAAPAATRTRAKPAAKAGQPKAAAPVAKKAAAKKAALEIAKKKQDRAIEKASPKRRTASSKARKA